MAALDLRAGQIDFAGAALDDHSTVMVYIPLIALDQLAGRQRAQMISARDWIARSALPTWATGPGHFRRINPVQAPFGTSWAADIVAIMMKRRSATERGLVSSERGCFVGGTSDWR